MDAIRRVTTRVGNSRTPLNQANDTWGRRAGRSDGPEAYISGDLCRSVFDKGRKMSPVERMENFGQAVLLLGVIDVGLGQDAEDSGSLFCSIVPLNVRGLPIEREKKMTKAVPVRHAYASFDEVFAFGRLCDLDAIHALKIKGVCLPRARRECPRFIVFGTVRVTSSPLTSARQSGDTCLLSRASALASARSQFPRALRTRQEAPRVCGAPMSCARSRACRAR